MESSLVDKTGNKFNSNLRTLYNKVAWPRDGIEAASMSFERNFEFCVARMSDTLVMFERGIRNLVTNVTSVTLWFSFLRRDPYLVHM